MNGHWTCLLCNAEGEGLPQKHNCKGKADVDLVNHPPHYTSHPSGVECIQITRHMNFNLGNALKYIWRAGIKSEASHIQDLEKAVFCLNDEIQRLKTKQTYGLW